MLRKRNLYLSTTCSKSNNDDDDEQNMRNDHVTYLRFAEQVHFLSSLTSIHARVQYAS